MAFCPAGGLRSPLPAHTLSPGRKPASPSHPGASSIARPPNPPEAPSSHRGRAPGAFTLPSPRHRISAGRGEHDQDHPFHLISQQRLWPARSDTQLLRARCWSALPNPGALPASSGPSLEARWSALPPIFLPQTPEKRGCILRERGEPDSSDKLCLSLSRPRQASPVWALLPAAGLVLGYQGLWGPSLLRAVPGPQGHSPGAALGWPREAGLCEQVSRSSRALHPPSPA